MALAPMTRQSTVLVTGGAGYIGAHAVLALRTARRRVVVLDNLSTGFQHAVPSDVPLIVGDIGDELLVAQVIAAHRVSAIMHFAGSVVVPDSVRDPLGYYRNNTIKSHRLIEIGLRNGVEQFIFSSTAAVYGVPHEIPVTEEADPRPINPYGASKLMTEWILRDTAAASALRYVALKYFNVAGADPAGRAGQSTRHATHLIKVACEAALGRRPEIQIFGTDYPTADGTGVRDYIHVSDLARAHALALQHLAAGGESLTLNCGYGHGHSVREVLEAVQRAARRRFAVREGPRRPGDPPALIASNAQLRARLGWQPVHDDLDAMVSSALDWEMKLGEDARAATSA